MHALGNYLGLYPVTSSHGPCQTLFRGVGEISSVKHYLELLTVRYIYGSLLSKRKLSWK